MNYRRYLPEITGSLLGLVVLGLAFWHIDSNIHSSLAPVLVPWASVAGCGAGGSGGGAGDGIKWVGQGVSGGMVEVEGMYKLGVGQNFQNQTFTPRFSFKPTWNTSLGLTLPFVSKEAEVQERANLEPRNRTTGGLGDVALDAGFTFGPSSEYTFSFGLTIPTGQYDIARGPETALSFLPSSLQKGGGLYNMSLGLNGSKDVDRGIWIWSVAYNIPFVTRFMTGRNEFMDEWLAQYSGVNDDRFTYDWKFYGENDLGDFTPQSFSSAVHYGYRGRTGQVHSFGLSFGAPMGVAWIRNPQVNVYDPKPDPDHKAWSAALVYGVEFIQDDFPLFMAFSLPIHDKANAPGADEYNPTPMQQWDSPDWEDFGQQWTLAAGFKTTFW